MRMPQRRQLLWTVLLTVATAVLALLLILIGVGYLRLPTTAASSTTITVTEVRWTIEQGTIPTGEGWFGEGEFNYTSADGWISPTFASGSSFSVDWTIVNFDRVNHTIFSVTVNSPFLLVGTHYPLPMNVVVGDNSRPLGLTISTASSASGPLVLEVTVNALA